MSASLFIRKFGKVVTILGLAIGGGGLFFWILTGAFLIRTIEVVGDNVRLAVDPDRMSKNLLLLSTEKLAAELQRDHPLLSSVTVIKRFPNTLVIRATARAPVAYVWSPLGLFLVDKEGILLGEKPRDTLLPRLNLISTTTPQAITALGFLSLTRSLVDIEEVSVYDTGSFIAKGAGTDIIFTQNADVALIIDTLQKLLAGFRIKGTLPLRVDLRFDKPVVSF